MHPHLHLYHGLGEIVKENGDEHMDERWEGCEKHLLLRTGSAAGVTCSRLHKTKPDEILTDGGAPATLPTEELLAVDGC